VCFHFNANSIEYKIGNLPPAWICKATPFANTGWLYGSFYIKEIKYRNRIKIKLTYVYLYVCPKNYISRAREWCFITHNVSDYFLAALRRFISRHRYIETWSIFTPITEQISLARTTSWNKCIRYLTSSNIRNSWTIFQTIII